MTPERKHAKCPHWDQVWNNYSETPDARIGKWLRLEPPRHSEAWRPYWRHQRLYVLGQGRARRPGTELPLL